MLILILTLIAIVAFILAYGFTMGYKKLVKVEYTYIHPDIPKSFDGYRIIHISDIHVGTFSEHLDVLEGFIDEINSENADLILFTGDLVNRHSDEITPAKNILSKIKAKDGIVAVMGNHDYLCYYKWKNRREQIGHINTLKAAVHDMGWQLLLNDNTCIQRGGDSIVIIGSENDGKPPFPAFANLKKAQKGVSEDCFSILLTHDPSHWRRNVLPETNIPLTLSGHTHAMQMKFFGKSPSAWIYPEWSGEYKEGNRTLIVSEGLGEVMWHFRFGAWPQYGIITLRKQ